mmetsp:Transcript_50894/g.142423  ORF Transcript_50894/g.142423 Transcript_50894/m.142423 type:complete len:752 (+) Transcript_50894:112-2367(+)
MASFEGVRRWIGQSEARAGSIDRPLGSSPSRGFSMIRTLGPQTHGLPGHVIWGITMLTAVIMALINFCTIWVISFIVEWKFRTVQDVIDDRGQAVGVLVLVLICTSLGSVCLLLIFCFAPGASSSGAPENKGWLNGNHIPGLFTFRNLVFRASATVLANATGFPVGREGPTVTMGSNLAFLITHCLALPYVRCWVDIDSLGSGCSAAQMIDEERFAHAKRIVCTVGGACGMAMLFDSPVGGILYMFEEITAASWPLEVTVRAFAGTTVCALLSRALLNLCGTTTKAFVVFEWNPEPQPWSWKDVPFFIILATFIGPFSAFHTRACLAVAGFRQGVIGALRRGQSFAKAVDALLYAALCATAYACVALVAKCQELPDEELSRLWVRFNCKEDEYNPVASLLLTTSEGAVKRLFSRKNANEIHAMNEFLAFVVYSALNIGLTGVSVPSGNFTGSMLIGGLAGRITGALVRGHGPDGVAVSGVYAMVGSAAMLCGFKQMTLAVVVFITGCANDFELIPPLMLSVTVSLLLNKACNERGFDEEQILRKGIPFLNPEPPLILDSCIASDLVDALPEHAVLPPDATVQEVRRALQSAELMDFPVVRDGPMGLNTCIGFTTRGRLEAALQARQKQGDHSSPQSRPSSAFSGEDNDEMSRLISASVGRESSIEGGHDALVPVIRLADKSPLTILQTMPAPRLYALYAKAGVRVACVVSEAGEYRGMISRNGLIAAVRRIEADVDEESRYLNHSASATPP